MTSNAAPRALMPQPADLPTLYRDLLPGLDRLAGNPHHGATADLMRQFANGVATDPALSPLLFAPTNPEDWTNAITNQFLVWRTNGYHLSTILQAVTDHFALPQDHPLIPAAAVASVLGSIPNDLPFHSADHTREVVAFAVALAAQGTFDDTATQMLEVFIAACIHDFAHDGFGNARNGEHVPMRLEQNALDHALSFLKIAHIPDPSWERICVMVLSTDVSKADATGTSPSEWMRMACENIDGGKKCPPLLAPLFDDKSLALQAALLEDADLAVSGGTPYDYARRMTALIAAETNILSPSPETLIGFIDHICHGAFITQAAKTLFGNNMGHLRMAAKQEPADTIYHWS